VKSTPHGGRPEIRTLSPEDITTSSDAFIGIAADQPGEYWLEAHFLLELPNKWGLSFAAWYGGRPVGYAILSRKSSDTVHLHHFMIAADYRGYGLGTRMIDEMKARARATGASRLTLKVSTENARAREFYDRAGFNDVGAAAGYRDRKSVV
jgi:ribosomal-protein-alanine N-acetyltransferase